MRKRDYLALIALSALLHSCGNRLHTQQVTFAADATLEEKIIEASKVVPSAKQLAWQRLETTAFIHFGINTFTGREWGDGQESPELFNPTHLDTDQWVECLKNAGFRLVILTAKHHDGFCLWPTATTSHSVASSPWMDGKGDVVRSLQQSCQRYGIKFGIYLSPWDRNASCYGDSPKYNEFFLAQLRELLTNYGTIDEVWFDGACGEGPNGKKQEYDFEAYYQLIAELQPNAVVAVSGNDVRWCGNEAGAGRDTEWSVTPLHNDATAEGRAHNQQLNISCTSPDLGSRQLLTQAQSVQWWPSEVDVSIRPGWFYHSSEDARVKTLEQLTDIYFNSVGKNSVLLLNIPPTPQGRIAKQDSINLAALGMYLNQMYATPRISTNNQWSEASDHKERTFAVEAQPINVVSLSEDITQGQRIEAFTLLAKVAGEWQTVTQGTTIGYKRMLRFPTLTTDSIKLRIESSRNGFNIREVQAYQAQEFISAPTISTSRGRTVSIHANSNAVVYFTTDGSDPSTQSTRYTAPFTFNSQGTIKAIALYNNGAEASAITTRSLAEAKDSWEVIHCSDENPGYEAHLAIDDDENSFWHTPWDGNVKPLPHSITIDCHKSIDAQGFTFHPRNDGGKGGIPFKYSLYTSNDAKTWKTVVKEQEFSNIKNNPLPQNVYFDHSEQLRYFRFEIVEEIDGNNWVSVAEIDLITNTK